MKKFLAVYTGSDSAATRKNWDALNQDEQNKKAQEGMIAWGKWAEMHAEFIVDQGAPLGKTKRVDGSGVLDIQNQMAAFVIVKAESHEAAAKMFLNHPHFTIFPGDGVEIMECLPMPTR